jgi:hypothetical protein
MAVDSLRDFEVAFEGIPLDRIGVGLTINAVASIMLAMFQAAAEKCGFPKDRVSATPQNDILKEMIGRGAWIFPVKPAVRLIGDTIEYSMKELPRTNPVSVCGYHIREAGATAIQELAFTLADGITSTAVPLDAVSMCQWQLKRDYTSDWSVRDSSDVVIWRGGWNDLAGSGTEPLGHLIVLHAQSGMDFCQTRKQNGAVDKRPPPTRGQAAA